MPFSERKSPPSLWSSFPSIRNYLRESALESNPDITPDITMGNSNSTESNYDPRKRNNTLSIVCHRKSKQTNIWDPPAYEAQDYKPPPYESRVYKPGYELPQITKPSGDSDSQYSFLKDFDTIFLVDDSSSMSGARWREAEEAIAAITPICTQYDRDGIDIHFLNHRARSYTDSYDHIKTATKVQEIFHNVTPRGSTPVGRRLLEILTPYLRRVERMKTGKTLGHVKPINIITITDGEFTDDAESIIMQVAKVLDDLHALPWQVGIQFFQIGDDANVRKYLQELDDDLGKSCRDGRCRDIVDTVPWRGKQGRRWMQMGF